MKLGAHAAAFLISVVAYYGFDKPKNGQDCAQVIVFSTINMFIAYNLRSMWTAVMSVPSLFKKPAA